MTEQDLQEIAAQLKHPNGEKGIEMADMMNETNIGMTKHAIACMNLQANDMVLELGHGNGGHLPYLFEQQKGLIYHGLEMSELMYTEAQKGNAFLVENKQAFFHLYDGINIPFPDNHFDKVFTVNTIYFWKDPEILLAGLYRIMKPNTILCITFGQAHFMEMLPFTQFGFNLYNNEKMEQLIGKTAFKNLVIHPQKEMIKTKMGDLMEREFATATMMKK